MILRVRKIRLYTKSAFIPPQDLRNIRRLAPLTPQAWGEQDLTPPHLGGHGAPSGELGVPFGD
jgi:hypothetical protein